MDLTTFTFSEDSNYRRERCIVNNLFVFKSLLTTSNNVLPLCLKQNFLPVIKIFTEGEGDEIKSRLPFKIFSTLCKMDLNSEASINYFPSLISGSIGSCHYQRAEWAPSIGFARNEFATVSISLQC